MLFSRSKPTPPPPSLPPAPTTAMEIPTTIITREPAPASGAILLIDDEPHVLAVGKAVLTSAEFQVVSASSGDQALDLIHHSIQSGTPYGAIVLDLTMPGGMSGFDTLEKIRELDPAVPVIACSGYFQEDARDLCKAIGFYDVLHKPYNLETMCTCVRRALARSSEPTSSAPLTYPGQPVDTLAEAFMA
jgi:CheY-like chemotaxis protein